MRTTLLLLALAACGDDGATVMPDAALPMPDAPVNLAHCPDPPADPTRPGRHVVYLNMEGVTLTKLGDCSDSKTNCTNLIKDDTATIPRFLDNTLGRDEFIAEFLRLARVRLAPYSIDLVTERPASGDYYMIVIGGDSATLTGVANAGSVTPAVCTPDNPNLVDLVFDRHFQGGAPSYASTLLSDLGAMYGVLLTSTPGDCMCRQDGCAFAGVCTYSPMIDLAVNAVDCGRGERTQDEQAQLKRVLGCR